jgi:signal transduction histidine kinase
MGTGLELSIVKKVIEMQGEKCGVESEEGKCSFFSFRYYRLYRSLKDDGEIPKRFLNSLPK